MTTYTLDLNFKGHDNVTGIIGGIANAFTRMGTIMGGIIGARMLWNIAEGIASIGTKAIEATAQVQMMQITLESLLAREYIKNAIESGASEVGLYDTALKSVIPTADRLMDSLANLAIMSPYSYQSVTQTYKQAMAFGFAADEAQQFTEATLNMAAGVGADNDMLNRMAYNLAQIRLQGKVTALDIRQLALAGFDLRSVLQYVGKEMGVNIQSHKDFNAAIASGKITWEDFTASYAKYADTYFGKASERLARSLFGLKSTFADVFSLTMPKILGPAVEKITGFLNIILNKFIALRDSGVFEEIGERLETSTGRWIARLSQVYYYFNQVVDLMKNQGKTLGEALSMKGLVSEDTAAAIDNILGKISLLVGKFLEMKSNMPDVSQWLSLGGAIKFVSDNFNVFATVLGAIAIAKPIATIVSLLLGLVNPVTIIIALGVLLYQAWVNNWGGIQQVVEGAVTSIQGALSKIGGFFAGLIAFVMPYILQLKAVFMQHLPAIAGIFESSFSRIGPVLTSVWEAIQPAITRFGMMLQEIFPVLAGNFDKMLTIFEKIAPIVGGVLTFLVGVITGVINAIINVVTVLMRIGANIQSAVLGIIAGILGLFEGVKTYFQGLFSFDPQQMLAGFIQVWTSIGAILGNMIKSIALIFAQPFAVILAAISGFVEGVIGFFTNLSDRLVGHSIIPDMVDAITTVFQSMMDLVNKVVIAGLTILVEIFTTLTNAISRGVNLIGNLFVSALNAAGSAIANLIKKVAQLIAQLAKLIIPAIFKQNSPSLFEQSMMDSAQALSALNAAKARFNTGSWNMPSSIKPPQGYGAGGSEMQQGSQDSRQIIFNFKDTTLDPSTLTQMMNRLAYV